jgi:peptidyl-dipeptidase Dcp
MHEAVPRPGGRSYHYFACIPLRIMSMTRLFCAPAALAVMALACSRPVPRSSPASSATAGGEVAAAEVQLDLPLLRPWTGPFGGVPPFDAVTVGSFEPAFDEAMRLSLLEIDRIAKSVEQATFDNTIVALERAGRMLARVSSVWGVWSGTMSTPEFRQVERRMSPKLAAYADKIYQNAPLFARIQAVYESPDKASLTPEQQRLAWYYHNNFVRAGAKLDSADKKRIADINQELAKRFTAFSQNVLADETDLFVVVDSDAELAGLPQSVKDAAAAAATLKGKPGKWVFTNTRSSMEPLLSFAHNRSLRERAFRLFVSRGDNGNAQDNNALIAEILALRAERAKLLGFRTHAHWRLENTMAKTPERALELMQAVWAPAVARVREEVADMQAIADKEGATITIEPWDYRYYAEKVRKAKYDLDENAIKPYMQLEKLREGMFWVAGELFGFEFKPISTVPVYHPDVRVWEVTDRTSGRHIGLWYFDPYAREGKRSGAWMNAYRRQERFEKPTTTIVSNNSNFVKGKAGEPVLISWDDATTLFHEFGHALHGLSSNVNYPSLSGTAVARDYVEFPSQLLEHWLSTPEVLNRFALHYQTGQPIPKALREKLERASTFNEGFATTEYLSAALVDMKLHLAASTPIDADAFERQALAELGMPREIVMRHRTPHFLHVFSSDSYSAGYYSYLWSDVLTADSFGAFTEAGGPYDRSVARRLHELLSLGNTTDPADAYRAFRGRDPRVEALMKKRGFAK